jgi:hypothetical protein
LKRGKLGKVLKWGVAIRPSANNALRFALA